MQTDLSGGQHKRSQVGEGSVGHVSSPTTLLMNNTNGGNHGCNEHAYLQDVFREDCRHACHPTANRTNDHAHHAHQQRALRVLQSSLA
eukprot:797613-Amphidinium_carterae.1